MRPVYLDNHSTTPLDPRVLEAMMPWLTTRFGNAASRTHPYGWEAEEAVEAARAHVARLVGASSAKEIVFTSGATESDNLAIKGVVEARLVANKHSANKHVANKHVANKHVAQHVAHVITCKTEHKAVLDTCRHLERQGARVTVLDVGADGRVDPSEVARAITSETVLVSIMLANNEVGTIQPIADIGAVTSERGVLLHCDAAQGLGRVPFDVEAMRVDLASVSAHKMYGPKGVGALYVRRRNPRVSLVAQIDGGGHERGMRSGTLNVPAIVGLGEAARIAHEEREHEHAHASRLRDALRQRLWAELEGVVLNGPEPPERHPGNLNVSFAHVESEALMIALKDDVAVSSGSACTSASLEPSYVLRAMGVDEERAHRSIRFGIGRFNTDDEVERVARRVIEEVKRLRELSPVWQLVEEGVDPDSIEW